MKDLIKKTNIVPTAKIARLMQLEVFQKQTKREIEELRADLLKVTQDLDVLTLKTGKYTISRAKRVTPTVSDFKTLCKSLDKQNIPYETMETFTPQMSVVFKEAVKQGRELDGLEVKETEYISIRVKDQDGR